MLKRIISLVLVLAMTLTLAPFTYAAGEEDDISFVDFDATSYSFDENQGIATIRVIRSGNTDTAVKIAYRIADFISEYGTDYEILNDNGDALERIEGIKPDTADIKFTNSDNAVPTIEDIYNQKDESDDAEQETAQAAEEEQEAPAYEEENTDGNPSDGEEQPASSGSALLDARMRYLGKEISTVNNLCFGYLQS